MKKELIFSIMIISMFLISACNVYNTLYVKQPEIQGEVITVPEGNITVEIPEVGVLEEEEEEISEEVEEEVEEVEVVEIEEEEVIVEKEVEIKIEDVEISEEATVIIVEETELVSLVPKAQDPDNDALIFTFTSPLNENGEWQTTYGDSGEYTITVTASDGTLTASKEVLVIVKKKEEAPVFDSFKPTETALEIGEIDSIEFDVVASDLNNDELTYAWKLDGVEVSNENSYEYKTTYEDSGSHTIKVSVSDGVFDTEKIWAVTVNNVNRKPVLEEIDAIEAKETDTVVIELMANDLDDDELIYEIDDERFVQEGNVFTWETNYDDAGEHIVTVSVFDGTDVTSQQVTITIENINRPPVIVDIIQK